MGTIWNLLLHRMQELMKDTKTPRYCRSFLHTFSLYAAVHGGAALQDSLGALDPGLVKMVVMQVWSFNRASCASAEALEVKQMVVGGTKVLCETAIANDPDAFCSLLKSVLALLAGAGAKNTEEIESFLDEDPDSREFDSTYSKLAYAQVVDVDPTASIPSGPVFFVTSLAALTRSRPGSYGPAIRNALDEKEAQALQALLAQSGHTIE
jgi:exportin-2 (importin alpha re-exporter)